MAVYDELHFGHAAEKLHIAQPPLSQAIRKLEEQLGQQLLKRTSRTVVPTAAGHVFAAEARKVLTSLDFAIAETQRVGRADQPLRVGCGIHIPSRSLQRFLAALQQRDSNLRTEVIHLLGLEQVGRLHGGELDLGVFTYAEEYEGLEWEPLLPGETLNVFLPKSHRLASKSVLQPRDLKDETYLCAPRTVNPALWDALRGALERAGYRFVRWHESSTDPRDVFMAIAGGLGFALGPASFEGMSEVVAQGLASIPLDPPISYPDTIVAWRADPPRALAQRLESVREAASELFRTTSVQAA